MTTKHRWYERLFYRLQLREKVCFRLVIGLLVLIIAIQFLLSSGFIRRKLVFTEALEGDRVKFYKSLSDK